MNTSSIKNPRHLRVAGQPTDSNVYFYFMEDWDIRVQQPVSLYHHTKGLPSVRKVHAVDGLD